MLKTGSSCVNTNASFAECRGICFLVGSDLLTPYLIQCLQETRAEKAFVRTGILLCISIGDFGQF